MSRLLRRVAALLLTAGWASAAPESEPLPRLRPLVGQPQHVLVNLDDTVLDIAYRHRLGFDAVRRLNPDVDVWLPPPGTVIHLPTRMVLPDAPEQGLVVNLPEMRLYDFTTTPTTIVSVAVGDAEDPTPIGSFRIGVKRVDPVWNVPDSIRAEKPHLPERVPPGPDNPLGTRWLTIGSSSYGLHGTNVRWSIGRVSTHGCIRLYEEDVHPLFDRVPEGTPLRLAYQPYKWGVEGRRLYLEVHPDLYGRVSDRLASALATPRALGLLRDVDVERVWRALDEVRGVPEWVGTLTAPR